MLVQKLTIKIQHYQIRKSKKLFMLEYNKNKSWNIKNNLDLSLVKHLNSLPKIRLKIIKEAGTFLSRILNKSRTQEIVFINH
jgi:hypothetical protein